MGYRPRTYYSESQKALMWERWQKGDSLQQIAQLFDRNHSSVQGILVQSGGIRPAQRHRAALALTLAEREEISRAVAAGQSLRSVSARLGRAPSTISRELQRNGGPESYRASQADQAAWDRAQRPKACKLVTGDAATWTAIRSRTLDSGRVSRRFETQAPRIRFDEYCIPGSHDTLVRVFTLVHGNKYVGDPPRRDVEYDVVQFPDPTSLEIDNFSVQKAVNADPVRLRWIQHPVRCATAGSHCVLLSRGSVSCWSSVTFARRLRCAIPTTTDCLVGQCDQWPSEIHSQNRWTLFFPGVQFDRASHSV